MQNLLETFTTVASSWLISHGIKIGIIIFVAWATLRFSSVVIHRLITKILAADNSLTEEARQKRKNTLTRIFISGANVVICILAGLIILDEAGFAIGPLLAAAGIAGVALGFGGQYLIRDLISGLFIIIENQYRIHDVVCFDGTCGTVEDISLRMTTLRDLDGVVHHVPHGEIKKVSNFTKLFARVNLNLGIAYSANLEQVISVVNTVGNELAADPKWKESVITPPQFLRVDDFADSAVIIKILGDTKPTKQWEVAGELRRRIKVAFDREGIEIPFPQRVIYQKQT